MSVSPKPEPKKRSKDRKIVIRSKTEPFEDQVDLCPRIWSREFSNRRAQCRDRPSSASHLWSKVWRLCFYCSCLPVCYPCYVSRSMRRRKRTRTNTKTQCAPERSGVVSPPPSDKCKNNLFDTSGDTMGKTMFHRVSQRKKDSDERLDVNVVLLRSESSPKVERYLVTKRQEEEQAKFNNIDEVDAAINKFINITRTLSNTPPTAQEINKTKEPSTSNGNVMRQGSSECPESTSSGGDAKSWKTFKQLQKWKQSFRRTGSHSDKRGPGVIVPSVSVSAAATGEEEQNLDSLKSSITEFFDARSVVSHDEDATTYHSFGSLGRNSHNVLSCDSLKVQEKKISLVKKVRHHVKPLGSRTVECEGIGYKLQVSIFDEGTITNWSGSDLDQLGSCNIDVVIVIISSNEEVNSLMNLNKGLLHYLGDNWRGFYPLLMVELDDGEEGSRSLEDSSLWCLATLFGDVYQLRLKENELFESIDWLTDVMGRLYLHSRLYQCSKFYGKGVNDLPECPGGCQLSKINTNKRILPFTRKKVKWKMRSLVRFSKMASEGASSSSTTCNAPSAAKKE